MRKLMLILPVLLLMMAVPSLAFATSGSVNETSAEGTLHTVNLTNVKSVLVQIDYNDLVNPQETHFNLTVDDLEINLYEHQSWFWNSVQIDTPNHHPYDVSIFRVMIQLEWINSTTVNVTTARYSDILGGWATQIYTMEEQITVPDDDPTVTLIYSKALDYITLNIDTDWEITSSTTVVLGGDMSVETEATWDNKLVEVAKTLYNYAVVIGVLIGYGFQTLPYVPLFVAFMFADAIMTGLIKGNWSPFGYLTTQVASVIVNMVLVIAEILNAVIPF